MCRDVEAGGSASAHAICNAAYLELAQWLSLPLATFDAELHAAAGTLGIALLGK